VSRQERADAQAIGIDSGRCVVIENGVRMRSVTLPPRPERSNARKVVVFAGRFDRQKGFDVFLQVLRRLGEEAQGYALGRTIVSDEVIQDVPANVELLGWRDRDGVLETFRRSDLLLMPSRWEGLPVVALEAMQAELAVFASRVGGLQDIVVDGETGRLFDLDDVEGIVGMISGTDIDTLEAYGRQGRARYEHRYTAERMSRLTLDLYRSLLQRGGQVPRAAGEL
jgi:glycosyltransferase involved in cell wall biosynthesis